MTRTAYAVFCDDIRLEQGNKSSLMGLYSTQLVVTTAPTLLPKLCCSVACATPADKPISSLSIEMRVGGTVLCKADVPSENLELVAKEALSNGTSDDPVIRYSVAAFLVLSPYIISEPHVIKAVAIADGEEIYAGRISVVVKNPEQPQT